MNSYVAERCSELQGWGWKVHRRRSSDPLERDGPNGLNNATQAVLLAAEVLTHLQPAVADLISAVELVTANLATVGLASMDPVTVNQATAEPTQGPRRLRPWGWYEVLAVGEGYQVKRLHLEPHRRFSLQRHHQRSEQWLVLAGDGLVQLGEEVHTVQLGQVLAVPVACVHRASAGPEGMEILEVQRGSLLSEDDIERFEDDYGRCELA